MNLTFCRQLRELDLIVYEEGIAIATTEFGNVTVRKASGAGYIAEIGDGEIPDHDRQSATPAMALMALRDYLDRLRNTKPKAPNVIDFKLPS
jgi:hypothetical protein